MPEDHYSGLSEEEIADIDRLMFSAPWQYDPDTGKRIDPDDSPLSPSADKKEDSGTREKLQELCWLKANRNPQVNTSLRGVTGRLTGFGFEMSSDIQEIQDVITEVETDWRNRLYSFWPKYVMRALIEGELFLCFSLHNDGFVEVDFMDPVGFRGGDEDTGVIWHPTKTTMPLLYCLDDGAGNMTLIPSIFIARSPELLELAAKSRHYNADYLNSSRTKAAKFKDIGGFKRFIVSWDKTFITKRNIGHVRTVLEWLLLYENLKKYEADHKKSSGAYLWVVKFDDMRSYMKWLSLSDEDRRKTGIVAKKTPGGTMVLGPHMDMKALNPSLPKISETDTDILHMVTAGLNEPEDVSTGQSKGTFASVKASRGPMSDRISDEIAYFSRFLRYDFWGSIFFLKNKVNGFPAEFKIRKAVSFKDKKPVFKLVKTKPENLIDINFPMSEINDAESRARAYLGVKHGSLYDTAGIPNAEIVGKLGFGNYRKMRLERATEEEKYPEMVPTMDQESMQERQEGELKRSAGGPTDGKQKKASKIKEKETK